MRRAGRSYEGGGQRSDRRGEFLQEPNFNVVIRLLGNTHILLLFHSCFACMLTISLSAVGWRGDVRAGEEVRGFENSRLERIGT
jgi:hypothetical protein